MIDIVAYQALQKTIGPAPWYWNTFPTITSSVGREYGWKFWGKEGVFAYLVLFYALDDPDNIRLVLNTYARPFCISPSYLGLWFPQDQTIQLRCFDPEALPSFSLIDFPADFKKSTETYYAKERAKAQAEISCQFSEGEHDILLPDEFASIEELLIIAGYKGEHNVPYALFEVHPKDHKLIVRPQKWFTADRHDIGYEWITRIRRHPESGRLIGDGIRISSFELDEDGCFLSRSLG